MTIEFRALDYHADDRFAPAMYRFRSEGSGWAVTRDDELALSLGEGYRPLDVLACGVCSTDLARRFLPFPLPQVIGHELVALDENRQRVVVEINASHRARGLDIDCPFCRSGLERHCPDRLVLGIHDLPGGFGPRVLAPVHAVIPVPDAVPSETAVLVEPFAAALNAVDRLDLDGKESVAVLGPRRLGMLVVAALAARRAERGHDFQILALSRHAHLLDLAGELGADRGIRVEGSGDALPSELADIVIDTTGSPTGFELALRLARSEVHLKSTHGQPSGGSRHLTELVVDELSIVPGRAVDGAFDLRGLDAARARREWEALRERSPAQLPRHASVLVDSIGRVDLAIRPIEGEELSLVAPRGTIALEGTPETAIERAVIERGLRISSSRCGDFREALTLLEAQPELQRLGERMITHRFGADALPAAFEMARRPECLKALVLHE
ncbi:MAG: alcohol dehydrogenase catalytic domain-containing protein [Planctomycetota bacterium]